MRSVGARARRYAEAIAQIAGDGESWDQWDRDLDRLASLAADPNGRLLLESPKVPAARKLAFLDQQAPGLAPLARNLAQLLIEKRSVELLPGVLTEFRRRYDLHRGIEHARVVSAVPLDGALLDAVKLRLAEYTGKQVSLTAEVDPDIIGGLIVRIGDKLMDGSARGRLEALRRRLAETR